MRIIVSNHGPPWTEPRRYYSPRRVATHDLFVICDLAIAREDSDLRDILTLAKRHGYDSRFDVLNEISQHIIELRRPFSGKSVWLF
jgi:hypothetical protein